MSEAYYDVGHPSKAKYMISQTSSIYGKSMKSERINCPISTANRIQNNSSQSLISVRLRHMSKRNDSKQKIKPPIQKKIKQGILSKDYKSKQKNTQQKDVDNIKSKLKNQLNYKCKNNQRNCDQIGKNTNQKSVNRLKKGGKYVKKQQSSNNRGRNNLQIPQNGIETNKNKMIEQLKSHRQELLKICFGCIKKIKQIVRQQQNFTEDRQQVIERKQEDTQINIERIQKQIKYLERLRRDLQEILQNIAKKKKRQPLPQRRRQRSSSRFQSSNLFSCNILNKEEDYKLFLIQTLSNNFGEIRQTKFLYHQDNLNQNNIHRYIDGKRNIAIIIQTVDDYFVALFAQPPFQPRQEKGKGKGLIIGLTQRRVYKNLPEKSPIVYDEAFVIFGNSDVKIGDKQIHTQFGNPTSYYDCKGDKASILFGSGGKKDFEIKYLEIFEVIF